LKNYPLRENLQNSVLKGFIATLIDVLCSNFMKFGGREIREVVRYLADKKFLPGSPALATVRIMPSLPGRAPDNVLRVPQISSKSVHFWRSSMRTCEHHENRL